MSQAYPDDVEKVISLMEAMVGAGNMMGPILGSFIYNTFGFEITFYIFGLVMVPISFLNLVGLPKPESVKEKLKKLEATPSVSDLDLSIIVETDPDIEDESEWEDDG